MSRRVVPAPSPDEIILAAFLHWACACEALDALVARGLESRASGDQLRRLPPVRLGHTE